MDGTISRRRKSASRAAHVVHFTSAFYTQSKRQKKSQENGSAIAWLRHILSLTGPGFIAARLELDEDEVLDLCTDRQKLPTNLRKGYPQLMTDYTEMVKKATPNGAARPDG